MTNWQHNVLKKFLSIERNMKKQVRSDPNALNLVLTQAKNNYFHYNFPIAEKCRKLSVKLLDQCQNTDEVDKLLSENVGSSKYFRFSKEMKYPRLREAIEHNNKEFIGHMYCQQILNQVWQGKDLQWQNSSWIYWYEF